MTIQFILCSDGASHKFLGITPYFGLKRLGINCEYFWPTRRIGCVFEKPDYIFVLKPSKKDTRKIVETRSLAIKCLIISDQRLSVEEEKNYDFFVTCSQSWQQEYSKRHADKSCYLIKEEYDYCCKKEHIDSENLNVVTMGYSNNLASHFISTISEIKKITNAITVITDVNEKIFQDNEINFVKFQPHSDYFTKEEWDKVAVSQFKNYDVGIITQYEKSGRPSTRGKAFLYAGLPIIAPNVIEYRDLWFNNSSLNIYLYNDIKEIPVLLNHLKDAKLRNQISQNNYIQIKKNYGAMASAKSFLKGIENYEKQY